MKPPTSSGARGTAASHTVHDDAQSAASRATQRSAFLALFGAVMLPMFLAAVDQTLLATATPRLASELGGLDDSAGVAVGYLLAATVAAPLYGRLGDRFGRREMLLVALAVFVGGSLSCALAGSMTALILSRVLQGLGGGGLMVLSQALIGELVAPRERARYQGYFAIVFTASSVGGPVLGGLVVQHGDWRWLFLANLPLGLIAAWRVWKLPSVRPSDRVQGPYDPLGLLLFVVCAVSAGLWLNLAGRHFAPTSATGLALLALALISAGMLVWQQRRHPNPFLPFDLVREPGVGWVCLSVIAFAGTMFALVFLLPIYLQVVHGASASGAGLQLLPLTAGLVVGSTFNGRFSARTASSGRLPPFGLAAAAAALATLALMPPSSTVTTVAAAICGLGFGTVMPSAQIATQMRAGRSRLGAAAALLSLTRSTGASLGTAAFGGLAFVLLRLQGAAVQGGIPDPQRLDPAAVAAAFQTVFAALAAFATLGALAAWRAPRMDLRAPAAERPQPD